MLKRGTRMLILIVSSMINGRAVLEYILSYVKKSKIINGDSKYFIIKRMFKIPIFSIFQFSKNCIGLVTVSFESRRNITSLF